MPKPLRDWIDEQVEETRKKGWFVIKSKIIKLEDRNNYFCTAKAEFKTPYVQVMRIEPVSLGGADALTYLGEALCETGPEIGKYANNGPGQGILESIWQMNLSMECADRSHPPLVMCTAAEFPKLYPQFMAAPSAPYEGDIYVLTLKAESGAASKAFQYACERITGQDPKPLVEFTFHGPFEGLMSSYAYNELTIAFHAVKTM